MGSNLKDSSSAFYRPKKTRKDYRTRGTRGFLRRRLHPCLNSINRPKIKYKELDDAIAALKRMKVDPTVKYSERLGIYSCQVCLYFHIGKTPKMQDPLIQEWVLRLNSRYPELEIEIGKRALGCLRDEDPKIISSERRLYAINKRVRAAKKKAVYKLNETK